MTEITYLLLFINFRRRCCKQNGKMYMYGLF